jgi:sugar phosphate isomerase/epimerase
MVIMGKITLALGLSGQYGLTAEKQIELYREAGFDGIFFSCGLGEDVSETVRAAEKHDMKIGSIHAPFLNIDAMWYPSDKTQTALDELLYSVRACAEYDIPVAVVHPFIGFDRHEPNAVGIENFSRIADEAEKLGVKIAFENTEGEMYLEAILNRYKDVQNVGFCFDSGHELCYNYGKDILSKYGERLFVTHLNDNMGMTGDELTFYDDSHLLPFDGIADWNGIAKRIKSFDYSGTLSFEVISKGRPTRTDNDIYKNLSSQEYVDKAYLKAVEFVNLLETI